MIGENRIAKNIIVPTINEMFTITYEKVNFNGSTWKITAWTPRKIVANVTSFFNFLIGDDLLLFHDYNAIFTQVFGMSKNEHDDNHSQLVNMSKMSIPNHSNSICG